MHVLALCGSLRAGSFNRGLLRAAADVAPEGVRVEVAEIGGLPLYNEDLERQGWPAPVGSLRDRAYEADAILFGCPEYNYGVSGVLKNAFDWLANIEGVSTYEDLGDFFTCLRPYAGPEWDMNGHHSSLNFDNLFPSEEMARYEEYLTGTIEFRQHAGTLDLLEILAWITVEKRQLLASIRFEGQPVTGHLIVVAASAPIDNPLLGIQQYAWFLLADKLTQVSFSLFARKQHL